MKQYGVIMITSSCQRWTLTIQTLFSNFVKKITACIAEIERRTPVDVVQPQEYNKYYDVQDNPKAPARMAKLATYI